MPVPMNALVTDGPSGAFGGPWASARAEGGCTMAARDCEATHLVVRAPSRSRLEPGHIGRTGAGSPGPAGAWDRVGPAVRHETLPAAYASMVAASTLADPARMARSFWRLHGTWGNRSVQRVVASARGIEADGDRMRHVERAIEDGRSGGQALDSGVQAQMGRPLAADFRGVRVHADAHGRVQRVGECAGKSKGSCSGSCVHTSGNPGTCRWSGTITYGCVCYENPKLSPAKQVLYNLIMAALIAAGIILTVAAIAAIVACLSGPCEVAALIAALGYAGAMIVLGIIRSGGGDTSSEASATEAAGDDVPGEEALA